MSVYLNCQFAMVKVFTEEIQKMLNQSEAPLLSINIYLELRSIIRMLSSSCLDGPFKGKALKKRMTLLIQNVNLSSENPAEICALLGKVNKAAIFYLLDKDKKESQLQELQDLVENPVLRLAPSFTSFKELTPSKENKDRISRALKSAVDGLFTNENDQYKREYFKIRMQNICIVLGTNASDDIPWEVVEKISMLNEWVLNIFNSHRKNTKSPHVERPVQSTSSSSSPSLLDWLVQTTPSITPVHFEEPIKPAQTSSSSSSSQSSADTTDSVDPLPNNPFSELIFARDLIERNHFKNPFQAIIDSEVSYDALEAVRFEKMREEKSRVAIKPIAVKDHSETDPSKKGKRMKSFIKTHSKKRKKGLTYQKTNKNRKGH